MLSNVQGMVKSVAQQAVSLATSAGQNPLGNSLSTFYVEFNDPDLIAYDNATGGNELDKVSVYTTKPAWVSSIDVSDNTSSGRLILDIQGTTVLFSGGYVEVLSTYTIGSNKYLGCRYYPDNDTLADPGTTSGNSYYCRTNG
jgi:hypothetical protein